MYMYSGATGCEQREGVGGRVGGRGGQSVTHGPTPDTGWVGGGGALSGP